MNNVNLIGRLTRDPELRYTTSGMAVVRFNLAVDRRMSKEKKQQAIAQNQPTADFISCTAWNKTAELIANYVQKGSRIAIEGRIQTGSYEKDGQRIFTTDVIVNQMDFLDSLNDRAGTQANTNNNFGNNQSFGSQQDDIDGFFPIDDEDVPF